MSHDLVIHERLVLSSRWFTYETMRASGPGGQSVNTTDSAVRLRFNLRDCDQLVPPVKQRHPQLRWPPAPLRDRPPAANEAEVLLNSDCGRSDIRMQIFQRNLRGFAKYI